MSDFNPKQHLIDLRGKDYLETKWRLVWFREDHPRGSILTEVVSLDPLIMKATVLDGENHVLATGHAGALDKGNAVWSGRGVEKGETAAIGRALGAAGYGTQFSDDHSDGDHLADSPTQRSVGGKPQSPRHVMNNPADLGQNGRNKLPIQPEQPADPLKEAGKELGAVVKEAIPDGYARHRLTALNLVARQDGGHQYILTCEGDVTMVLYSADVFREAGFAESRIDGWKQAKKLNIPADQFVYLVARQTVNGKGNGQWDVARVDVLTRDEHDRVQFEALGSKAG